MADSLASIGTPISHTKYVEAIFDGLEEEDEGFITYMLARVEPYTIEELKSLLMTQEEHFVKKKKVVSNISANLA